ncbi:DMT family transporter [Psychrobacter aestuarii]|uniref:EamA family transporter n=1 Tax=Psychrobacter aestuarii TaxID=556327 RepID=A0ABP3FE33_9GAMM|nr:EamA family transporter [Psychrobacter aestuarii]
MNRAIGARPSVNHGALIGSLQVIMAGVCWGTLGIFSTQLGAMGFSSFQITILRILTAGVLLLTLLPQVWSTLKTMQLPEWMNLILQSLVGVLGMTLCYFFAVAHVGVSMAVALLYTAPIFSLIFARVILGEAVSIKSALLAIVAVMGVACLMLGDKISVNLGMLVGLLSGVCYSLFGILGKKALSYQHPPNLVLFSSVTFSAAVLLFLPQTYQTYGALIQLPMSAWALALGLSVVGTIAPFFLYTSALNKLSATKASVFTIIEPLTAITLAVVLLNQSLKPLQTFGVVLIVFATLVNAVGAKS